ARTRSSLARIGTSTPGRLEPDGEAPRVALTLPESREALAEGLAARDYIVDDALAMSVFLALQMRRPLFLEGAPGVGKTLLARVLAELFETRLIRLQCYEGLDISQAAYEWNYPRQLLELQARGARGDGSGGATEGLFREAFLLKRPLLQAIDAAHDRAPVLLIDELDRADEEFESFLLELLGDFQITIPELGTLTARHRPIVVLTSNRTRDVHDALKRRCLYHWIDYPSLEKEVEIVRRRVPGLAEHVRRRIVAFVQRLRREDLSKLPGVAETVDWAEAIEHLGAEDLDPGLVGATLGLLLKHHDDMERVRGALVEQLLADLA
ncbi:MAG TPA: MoxR family ATPase, partial [Gemmatimonadaceae bacterium]|nr:MoxR family ATPase [Gemmatimonadaceae bacterium]